MKKEYSKPDCTSEQVFETLAAGCTFISADDDTNCDPMFGGAELNPGS
jgi:hypothetical protein